MLRARTIFATVLVTALVAPGVARSHGVHHAVASASTQPPLGAAAGRGTNGALVKQIRSELRALVAEDPLAGVPRQCGPLCGDSCCVSGICLMRRSECECAVRHAPASTELPPCPDRVMGGSAAPIVDLASMAAATSAPERGARGFAPSPDHVPRPAARG